MRVLVTRPEPDAERTAAKLRARGCVVMLAPLLRLEIREGADFGDAQWDAVVMTSTNAVRAIAYHPRRGKLLSRPVFAVGRRTAEAARAAGFGDVRSADGDKQDLVRLLAARKRGDLLYLAGEDRAGDLASDLAAHGLNVHTVVVYRAVAAPAFPPGVAAALTAGEIDGVLHFSRRSAEVYIDCATTAGILVSALRPLQYCLSRTVAEFSLAAGASQIKVAPRPEEAALVDVIAPG